MPLAITSFTFGASSGLAKLQGNERHDAQCEERTKRVKEGSADWPPSKGIKRLRLRERGREGVRVKGETTKQEA